jgi:hypothetical protein
VRDIRSEFGIKVLSKYRLRCEVPFGEEHCLVACLLKSKIKTADTSK